MYRNTYDKYIFSFIYWEYIRQESEQFIWKDIIFQQQHLLRPYIN